MTASVAEQILARVKDALIGATSAGTQVYRGRVDNFASDEDALPALNIRRREIPFENQAANIERALIAFEVEHFEQDTSEDGWETAIDALHMEAHAVLTTDAELALLGRGLRCTNTNTEAAANDRIVGKLTAQYQMQALVRSNDLTRALS
jgi:hypothetical protein